MPSGSESASALQRADPEGAGAVELEAPHVVVGQAVALRVVLELLAVVLRHAGLGADPQVAGGVFDEAAHGHARQPVRWPEPVELRAVPARHAIPVGAEPQATAGVLVDAANGGGLLGCVRGSLPQAAARPSRGRKVRTRAANRRRRGCGDEVDMAARVGMAGSNWESPTLGGATRDLVSTA
jgi:hypothetical protein